MAYVYCHYKIGSTADIFYIGVGGLNKFDNYKRAKDVKSRSNVWKWMSSKIDWGWEIMYDNLTKEEALLKEKELIACYKRYDLKTGILSNLTDGGEGGCGGGQSLKGRKRNPEIFKKGKETLAKKGGFKHSEESKNKISERSKGVNNPFYGKKQPKWVLDKQSKIVLNLETGIFYDSIKQACRTTYYNYDYFKTMLSNTRKNKTNFIKC